VTVYLDAPHLHLKIRKSTVLAASIEVY